MEYQRLQDNELLLKLVEGDQNAFDEIYRRYWNGMFQSAYNILRERESCMDIVQELFTWLWENRSTLNIACLKPYLLVAVKFKVANYIKKGKVRSSFFDQLKKIEEPYELIEDSLEVKEMMDIIDHSIDQLPVKCKEIFLLRRREHLSNMEIAERLNISVKTVENQMTIALKKLKSSLSKISSILVLLL